MAGNISKKQAAFIESLTKDSSERNDYLASFLRQAGKSGIRDLTLEEASKLISSLKGIKTSNSQDSPPLTKKQKTYLESLLRNEAARVETGKFLNSLGLVSIDDLRMDDASRLIDSLKKTVSGRPDQKARRYASKKQINFIRSLATGTDKEKILVDFLKGRGKSNIEDLFTDEASEIIDLLKSE
ncbi:MAG TPA: hypothetical protein VKU79_05345 [Thermoplasmataceae archaeon]|nr:hypothetical protein [Thermoplasmatales archaeon AK]HLH86268.1 hypothetical protein [Thermoplasmataceae archaeon]